MTTIAATNLRSAEAEAAAAQDEIAAIMERRSKLPLSMVNAEASQVDNEAATPRVSGLCDYLNNRPANWAASPIKSK